MDKPPNTQSSSLPPLPSKSGKTDRRLGPEVARPLLFIFVTIFSFLGFLAFSLIFVQVMTLLGISRADLNTNVFSSVFAIVAELFYFAVVWWCVKRGVTDWKGVGYKVIGPIKFIIFLIIGLGWYILLSVTFGVVVKMLFPGFNASEPQQLGITELSGAWQYVLAYISLALVPAIAEETLFRGFLFKGLREKWPFWLSALVTSVLFALAHGQLNVGLDVFALSLVLCVIVEKTGSIYVGIVIHLVKNSFAFIILYTHLFPMLH